MQIENTQADIERALDVKKARRSAASLNNALTVEKDRVETLQGKLNNTMADHAKLVQERKKGNDTLINCVDQYLSFIPYPYPYAQKLGSMMLT